MGDRNKVQQRLDELRREREQRESEELQQMVGAQQNLLEHGRGVVNAQRVLIQTLIRARNGYEDEADQLRAVIRNNLAGPPVAPGAQPSQKAVPQGADLTIYVAGPYSLGDPLTNVQSMMDTASKLRGLGGVPFVPLLAHFWDQRHPMPYECWMEGCKVWVTKCSALYRMPGESKGADEEVKLAKRLGIPVFTEFAQVEAWVAGRPARDGMTEPLAQNYLRADSTP